MNDTASLHDWPLRLQQVSEDPRKMTPLLSTILFYLLYSLAETTAKDSFILPMHLNEVEIFVAGFNSNERREWEDDGIRTCMERGDWTVLITHRMYAVTLQDVFFDHCQRDFSPLQTVTPNKASLETMCVLSVSVGGSCLFISHEGRSEPCDCMPCLVKNIKETFTSSL